jgi:hypothetical protein
MDNDSKTSLNMHACQRCASLEGVVELRGLFLCLTCALTGVMPHCGSFKHRYRGARNGDGWQCLTCGTLLPSQKTWSTQPVEVKPIPTFVDDC